MDHWESCVYLGGADGRIFQADLQRRAETDAFVDGSTMPNSLQQQGIHVLSGHARSVSSLACTMDSFHLVSGENPPLPSSSLTFLIATHEEVGKKWHIMCESFSR